MVCFSGGCYHQSVVMLFTALVFMVCQLLIDKHLAWQVVQQLEIAPVSDSLTSVIKQLLGIKFNSLYMPLLNDDEVMFILDFMCTS